MTQPITHNESLEMDSAVRAALSKAFSRARKRGKTRKQVLTELRKATGVEIKARTLECHSAESRRAYRFPAAWVVPFCQITGDDSLQRVLLGPALARVLVLGEQLLALGQSTIATDAEPPTLAVKSERSQR